MRVAVYIPHDLNTHGGVEKHVLRLADGMRAAGVEVDVFGKYPPSGHFPVETTETFYPLGDFDLNRYDVIHTHSGFYDPASLAMQLRHSPRRRFVHTLHTVSLDYLFRCKTWWNWRCYWSTFIEGLWSRYADHVIAVSESTRRMALKYFRIPGEKCSVILNGFDPDGCAGVATGQQEADSVRKRYGIAPDQLLLLFVGRGEDRVKGTRDIAAAMDVLHREFPPLRLLAVPGSGFEEAPWLIRSGPIAHKQVASCYAAADIFINASLSEGFPLTVVEALATGLAVLAAPVGGIREVIKHGENGLLLHPDRSDLAGQLRRLIRDEGLRKYLGQRAAGSVAHLTWNNLARQTIAVYESLCSTGPRREKQPLTLNRFEDVLSGGDPHEEELLTAYESR